ncbi:pirin family protein [Kordiimonas sp. SCSIO 12610]|uniref:pirin family protein n=1 Tax=Kordiimonas sp. SCSIO 12610 TaxID=2829597 RepID=UPI0021088234|nr:pirin family protein [Kordiimonas sp. SCSIO 12610]UTW55544.1 pirin family protein [Kordiimonas sp. SCSIO 12610]
MTARHIQMVYPAETMSEGVRVTVHRTIGKRGLMNLDPFLLLDEFELKPGTGAGFPEHPHRGFETMTYMLSGAIKHTDTVGNTGVIRPGDAQWMTAGSGIIHSEMPVAGESDIIHGLQLWVNLPAADKMKAPQYRDASATNIPLIEKDGYIAQIIAGEFEGTQGPINDVAINPLYMDITLSGDGEVSIPVEAEHTVFLYVITGAVKIDSQNLEQRSLIVLTDGEKVQLSGDKNSRFLLVAGRKINEPVARYGPFVMNTREEILATIDDFNNKRFPGQS